MRTTLKRGVGRAGALSGNGKAVLPPAAQTPVAVYRAPEPPQRSGWQAARRYLGWFLVAATMIGAGLLGGAYLYFHESVAQIRAHSVDVKTAQRRLSIPLPGQAAIALVIGYLPIKMMKCSVVPVAKQPGYTRQFQPVIDKIMISVRAIDDARPEDKMEVFTEQCAKNGWRATDGQRGH